MKRNYLYYIFLLSIFTLFAHAGAIKKNVRFTWMDGQEHNYVGNPRWEIWHLHGDSSEARLKTITFYDESIGADRVIDFEHNVQMDFDYALTTDFSIHADDKKLFVESYPDSSKNYKGTISKDDVRNNTSNYQKWVNAAKGTFRSPNLNYYVGGDGGTSQTEVQHNGIPGRGTVIHKLTYPTPFKVSNSLGGGYVFVSERGGNNSQYVVARDVDDNILGAIRVQQSSNGSDQCSQDINNPNVSYVNTGRAQNNGQEICMAIFPLRDLASPGTSIKSIELLAVDTNTKGWYTEGSYEGDAADGKIFLVHELAEPDVCYDYSVRQGGHTLVSKDRKFTAVGSGDISIAMGLRSMESDYDMMHSRVSVSASGLLFDEAKYAPNHVNKYEDAIYIYEPGSDEYDSSHPEIAIGNDPQSGANGGGTIKANERYFSKYIYNNAQGDKIFNIDLNITVDISEGQNNPIIYLLTSDPLKYNVPDSNYTELKRCEQSQTYNPEWLAFNVERTDSKDYTEDNKRYPLYTQVAGKDFDFSVVAYDANSSYKTPLAISDTTVQVELIDVSSYDDNNSFFRCSDPNPEIVQKFGTNKRKFVYFDNNKERVDVADEDDLDTSRALRNAAFRMWVLVDTNNTLLHHHCADNYTVNDTCFQTLYDNNLSSQDTQGYCSNCSAYTGGCYQCLKDHFAIPICSRDNFSIRPEAFHIAVSDTDEENAIDTTSHYVGDNHIESTVATLAAGYKYTFDANATVYGSDTNALGYQKDFYALPDNTDIVSRLSFDTSTGTSCADQNATEFPTRFFDGKIIGTIHDTVANPKKNLQSNANVGKYTYHMHDINWTMVDQARFIHKTFPGVNDCEGMDANNQPDFTTTQLYATAIDKNGKSGCGISSNYQQDGINNYDLALRFEPYSFDVSEVNLTLPHGDTDNFVYFNTDINNTVAQHMSAHFEGNITALNAENHAVSNFTTLCAAHDVSYDINLSISRFDTNVTYPIALQDADFVEHNITLRRNYINDNGNNDIYPINDLNNSTPATISADQFQQDNNGSANVKLLYNFNRIANLPISPLRVSFDLHHAKSTDANSSADLGTHTPEGNATIDKDVDFVYGRVVTASSQYIIPTDTSHFTAALYVEVYCEGNATACATHGLDNNDSIRDGGTTFWQLNAAHDSDKGDGKVDINGTGLTINPDTDVDISNNPTNVDVSIPLGTNTQLCIDPDVSWLDPSCVPASRLNGGGWAGTGKTGLVVETNASTETQHRRSTW